MLATVLSYRCESVSSDPQSCVKGNRVVPGQTWKLAYCLMQKGWAVLQVMACSQKTCSGHCTTALLRMRFMAYWRPDVSSVVHHAHLSMTSPVTAGSCQRAETCLDTP